MQCEVDRVEAEAVDAAIQPEPRDIEQSFTVSAGEVKYMKLNVQYNLNEMNLGQPSPSYTLFLMPVRADDARYEIRNTSAVD